MAILKPMKPVLDPANSIVSGLVFDDPMYLGVGNTVDIVNNNTGTLSGVSPASWIYATQPGLGNGLSFNGTSSYISYPDISAYDLTTSAISIEIWTVWSSSGTGQYLEKPHVNGSHTSPFFSYSIHAITSSSARMWLTTSGATGGDHTLDSALSMTNGVLYQIVGTYDGSNMRIYQDAVLKDTHGITGTITSFATNLLFGAHGGLGELVTGNQFIARIWNRTLSQAEISLLQGNPFRIYLQRSIRETKLKPRPFAPGITR